MKLFAIGVVPQGQICARMLDITRGRYQLEPTESKIWFTSMRSNSPTSYRLWRSSSNVVTVFADALREFLARETIHEPMNRRNAQVWLFEAIRDDPEVDPRELLDLVLAMSRNEGAKFIAHSEGAIALASRKAFLDAETLAAEGPSMVPALAAQVRQAMPPSVRPAAA